MTKPPRLLGWIQTLFMDHLPTVGSLRKGPWWFLLAKFCFLWRSVLLGCMYFAWGHQSILVQAWETVAPLPFGNCDWSKRWACDTSGPTRVLPWDLYTGIDTSFFYCIVKLELSTALLHQVKGSPTAMWSIYRRQQPKRWRKVILISWFKPWIQSCPGGTQSHGSINSL